MIVLLWRLDRLGRQLEAVCANIKAELAPTEDRAREILKEWRENKHEQAKEQKIQFIVWGGIIAAAFAVYFLRH